MGVPGTIRTRFRIYRNPWTRERRAGPPDYGLAAAAWRRLPYGLRDGWRAAMTLGLGIGGLATLVLAVGCASSTLARRKIERSDAYEQLGTELQAGVDQGEIREQMDTNAVYIAWGKPTRVEAITTPSGLELRWEYWRKWIRTHPHWSIEPGPGGYYATTEYRPTTSSWKYLAEWVVFRNDRVIRWGRFPRPAD